MEIREDLGKNPLDKILEAIESGNKDEAVACATQAWQEWKSLHDIMAVGYQLFLGFISEKLGEDAVRDAWVYLGDVAMKPQTEIKLDDLVQAMAAGHRAHGSEFHVEEDDEKIVFVVESCGTGGMMRKEGMYDNTDRNPMMLKTCKRAYPWSFNQKGVSYHCTHCAIWFDSSNMPSNWQAPNIFEHQYGEQFDDDGNPTGEVCKHIFYKKPRS